MEFINERFMLVLVPLLYEWGSVPFMIAQDLLTKIRVIFCLIRLKIKYFMIRVRSEFLNFVVLQCDPEVVREMCISVKCVQCA